MVQNKEKKRKTAGLVFLLRSSRVVCAGREISIEADKFDTRQTQKRENQ